MKDRHIASFLLGVPAVFISSACSSPRLDYVRSATISRATNFGTCNLSVIEIDPHGRRAKIVWQAFNHSNGSWANVPFEILTVESGQDRYVISDKNVLNNEIEVNGKAYHFDDLTQRVRIRIGGGIEIVPGGDYQRARKIYEMPSLL